MTPQPVPLPRKLNPMQAPQQPDNAGLFFQALQARQQQQRDQQLATKALMDTVTSMASLMEKKREADMENAQGQAMLDIRERMLSLDQEKQRQSQELQNYLLNARPTSTTIGGKAAVVVPGKSGPSVKFAPQTPGTRQAGDDQFVSGADAQRYGVPANTTYGQLREKGLTPISEKSAQAVGEFDTALSQIDALERQLDAVGLSEDDVEASASGILKMGKAALVPASAEGQFKSQADNISRLARQMGEKGVLTEQDVSRVINALPGFRDTTQSKRMKMDILRDLIEEGQDNITKGITRDKMRGKKDTLSNFFSRKKSAGVSKPYIQSRAKELLQRGQLLDDRKK